MRALATEVLRRGSIETTLSKAKAVSSVVDRLITLAKRGDLHARRQALAYVYDKEVVQNLFANVAARYPDRRGGYTRVVKTRLRLGDAAPMAVIQLVEGAAPPAPPAAKATKATKADKAAQAAKT